MSATDARSLKDQQNVSARKAKGEFVRGVSAAKQQVTAAAGGGAFPAEAGRYHLYVAYNCPWCHRVAIARALLGLEDVVSMDVAMPVRSEEDHPEGDGKWVFAPEGIIARNKREVRYDLCTPDTVNGKGTAVEIYRMNDLTERSLPMLFDKQTNTVVNNESFDIVRMCTFVALCVCVSVSAGRSLWVVSLRLYVSASLRLCVSVSLCLSLRLCVSEPHCPRGKTVQRW